MPRPRTVPVRNQALAASITGSGHTYASIAEAINRVGAENGVVMHCTAASLAKWLNGVTPQASTAQAAVEAFSRLLGQPELTAADLGWPEHATPRPQSPWQGDPVIWITHLGRDDMLNRRSALTAGLYSLTAAAIPATPHQITSRSGPSRSAALATSNGSGR